MGRRGAHTLTLPTPTTAGIPPPAPPEVNVNRAEIARQLLATAGEIDGAPSRLAGLPDDAAKLVCEYVSLRRRRKYSFNAVSVEFWERIIAAGKEGKISSPFDKLSDPFPTWVREREGGGGVTGCGPPTARLPPTVCAGCQPLSPPFPRTGSKP